MLKFAVVLFFVAAVTAVPTAPVDPRIELNGDWRVVGGSNAPAGAYPFIVSLRSSGNAHFCGGSVLNGLNILTAAHCVVGRTTGNTITVAGTNTLNAGGTSRATARLLIHANYNPSTIANDIAVVRMSTNLGMTNLIQQTSLNTANTGAVAAILIGWGRTCTTCGLPNNLQHLATNTITHAACVSSWGSLVAQSQICAVIGAGRGACNGDSGGPLIQTSNSAQLGLASFIRAGGCAQGFPDVYVRVSSFIAWIQSAVNA
ncbi:Trypsin [Popillia japonica]|uniref:Trypsin n=1 Tax=Popillia japonica TaxID=7064 RepID=A0AAW1IA80_POPJA